VLKSIKALCEVFCDILPSYRIREQKTDINEDNTKDEEGNNKQGGKKSTKVSKEVKAMREHE